MTRKREEVMKRRAEAVFLREQGKTYREIAENLGYRSHASVHELIAGDEAEVQNSASYRKIRSETCRKFVGNL